VDALREATLLLRLRFSDSPLTHVSHDAMLLNESPNLAALVTYSDVLRARALSLLRRLAALRSRISLQMQLNQAEAEAHAFVNMDHSADTGDNTDNGDVLQSSLQHQQQHRMAFLKQRANATLQELEDFAVDAFRKTDVALQLKTIEHEILSAAHAASFHADSNSHAQEHAGRAGSRTALYLDRISDAFVMCAWDQRFALPIEALRMHKVCIESLVNTLPKSPHAPPQVRARDLSSQHQQMRGQDDRPNSAPFLSARARAIAGDYDDVMIWSPNTFTKGRASGDSCDDADASSQKQHAKAARVMRTRSSEEFGVVVSSHRRHSSDKPVRLAATRSSEDFDDGESVLDTADMLRSLWCIRTYTPLLYTHVSFAYTCVSLVYTRLFCVHAVREANLSVFSA